MQNLNPKDIKLIIFDLDGVILDSEPLHEEARQIMYKKYGVTDTSKLPVAVGISMDEYWEMIKQYYPISKDAVTLQIEHYDIVEKLMYSQKLEASVGLRTVIEKARRQGINVAVASSSVSNFVYAVLHYLDIVQLFDVVTTANDVSRKKPDPEPYQITMKRCGIDKTNAIAIEDSKSGVAAAKSAGIYCIGYRNVTSGNQDISGANEIIDSLKKLLDFIRGEA